MEGLKTRQRAEETELDRILGNNNSPGNTDSETSLDSFDLEFERLINGPSTWDQSDRENSSPSEDESTSDPPCLSSWKDKTSTLIKIESTRLKQLDFLQKKLTLYTNSLPVFGFNSAKYDTNLILAQLIRGLEIDEKKAPSVIKRGQTYQLIETQHFCFLDVVSFLAPGVNYSKFLNMYNASEQKFFFPYEFLDDPKKLEYDRLPSMEHFYLKLKGRNTLGESECEIHDNYRLVQHVWECENMCSLKDLLMYYNKVDVNPGVTALKLLFRAAKEKNAFFCSFS